MSELNVCRVKAVLLLSCLMVLGISCVNEDYDMSGDRLNLEVTPFQEGLTFPLGKTDSIMLADLLKDLDVDILDTTKNYTIKVADTLDLSENLPSLDEMLDIDDIPLDETLTFTLEDVDVSDIAVEEKTMPFDYAMPEITVPDMPTVDVNESFEIEAGISSYIPNAEDMKLDFKEERRDHDVMSFESSAIKTILQLAGLTPNDEIIPISQYKELLNMQTKFGPHSFSFPIDITLPEGITSVDEIILHEDAKIKLSVYLEQNILCEGEIIPDFELNLSELFVLEGEGNEDGIVDIKNLLPLNKENNYSNSCEVNIKSFVISEDDWEGAHLAKIFSVSAGGELIDNGLKTTTNLLTANETNVVKVHFALEFENLSIEGINANIDEISLPQHSEMELKLDDITIPEEINKISYVSFDRNTGISLLVQAENLDRIKGLDAVLNNLNITFPEWIEVEGADETNTVSVVSQASLKNPVNEVIRINRINLPEPEAGVISFGEAKIIVDAKATASGSVNTATLPTNPEDDIKLVVSIVSDLAIDDYEVIMNDYNYPVDIPKEEVKVEIPEAVADMHEIIIYPEKIDGRDPEITLDMSLPDLGSLKLMPLTGQGLKISFPKMIEFGDVPESYHYNRETHSLHFTDDAEIPTSIKLPVSKLVITPEKDETDGKFYAQGAVEIVGGITLKGAPVHKADVDAITRPGQKVSVVAFIPRLAPASISLDSYQTSIEESIDLDILEPGKLPKELVGIGEIKLDGTKVNFGVDAQKLPDFGDAELTLDVTIAFPEFVKIKKPENPNVVLNGSVLGLIGKLDKNKQLNFPEITIEALDMTNVKLEEGIKGKVDIDVDVTLANASLNVEEWLKDDLTVSINGGVSGIKVSTVTAKVGYDLTEETMKPQEVDLSEFTKSLTDLGVDAKLAFNHAHIALVVETNLGVPIDAKLELLPYYDGQLVESKKVSVNLDIRTTADAKPLKLWVAENNDDTRMPDGYTLVPVNGLLSLFTDIPEKLEIVITGGTDRNEDCVLDLREELKLEIAYAFELPLEFGEGFEVTYKTDIPDIPEIVGEVLAGGLKVKLLGEIRNALPLGLDLKINFLDAEGGIVESVEGAGRQVIKPCGYEPVSGQVTVASTPLDILVGVKNPEEARNIKSLQLEFNANSKDAVGIPITKDAHLQAVLQLSLPEGVTIDLKELMNNDDEQ